MEESDTVNFRFSLPEKEPYEGKATQKQKQKIWELGYKDTSVIDGLGKKQASYLIDKLLEAHGTVYTMKQNTKAKKKAKWYALFGLPLVLLGCYILPNVNGMLLLLIGGGLTICGGINLIIYRKA